MGSVFPTVLPWGTFTGDFSVSNNGQALTVPSVQNARIKSPWVDLGASTINIQRTGTSTGTMRGRTSAAMPPSNDESVLLLPGSSEWSITYDPSLGTLPTSQSWGHGENGASDSIVSNMLHMNATGWSWYSNAALGLSSGKSLYIAQWRWCRGINHQAMQLIEAWYPWPTSDITNGFAVKLMGTNSGSNAGKLYDSQAGNYIPNLVLAVDDVWDFWLVTPFDGTNFSSQQKLWARKAGVRGGTLLSQDNLDNAIVYGNIALSYVGLQNYCYIGDPQGTGQQEVYWGKVRFGQLGGVDIYGWENLTNPDATFSRNQRYWQIDFGNLAAGTVTELDLQTSLTPPANVAGTVPVGLIGTNIIAAECVSGANLSQHWRLIDQSNNSTSQEFFTPRSSVVFENVPNGTYKVGVKYVTASAIESTTEKLSSTINIPPLSGTQPPDSPTYITIVEPPSRPTYIGVR